MRCRQACKIAGTRAETVWMAIRRGAIPAVKKVVPCVTGRKRAQWLLDLDDLLAWRDACHKQYNRKPIDPNQTAASLAQERGIKLHSARRALLRARGK